MTTVTWKASATTASVTVLSNLTYYPFGPQNVFTFGNGRTLTKTYDTNYAIDQVVSSASDGLMVDASVDVLGNLIDASATIGATPKTQKYRYDPLFRLTAVTDGNDTALETFTYDLTGDRLSKTLQGQNTQTYTYMGHKLTSVAGAARNYDLNGNTTAPVAGQYPTLTYDDRNRLARALLLLSALTAGQPGARISAEIRKAFSDSGYVDLASAFSAQWQRVCILGPYSDNAAASRTLGFAWNVEARSSIRSDDGISLLVFVQDDKVIAYAEHQRRYGDFADLSERCFPREHAKFVQPRKDQSRVAPAEDVKSPGN